MTTLADRIRAAITAAAAEQGESFRGLTAREIAAATGETFERIQLSTRRMRKYGLLSRLGHDGRKGARYGIGRDVLRVYAHPPEDAERLRKENKQRANREYKRRKAAERKPRLPAPKPQKDRPPYHPREVVTAPAREPLPDSSAWLAANEGKYERLPAGEVSPASRLRFDHRRTA